VLESSSYAKATFRKKNSSVTPITIEMNRKEKRMDYFCVFKYLEISPSTRPAITTVTGGRSNRSRFTAAKSTAPATASIPIRQRKDFERFISIILFSGLIIVM